MFSFEYISQSDYRESRPLNDIISYLRSYP